MSNIIISKASYKKPQRNDAYVRQPEDRMPRRERERKFPETLSASIWLFT